MPEIFEETVATIEITFRPYFLYFVVQFVFQNTRSILLKMKKYISSSMASNNPNWRQN